MIKKFYNLLIFLTGFSLLWQTKIILRPEEINYWEISLFFSMIFLFIFIIVFNKKLLLNFKYRNYLEKTLIALVFLELFIIISIFFSPDILLSLYRYLIFILAILLYLIVKNFNFKQKKYFISGVFLAGFFQAIIAFLQFIWQKSVASKYLGMAFHDAASLGTAVVESSSGRWLRAYGALDHPNVLGGVLALICLWSAWFIMKYNFKSDWERIFLWLVYLSTLAGLFFSFSRSAWLAFLLVKIILVLYFIFKKHYYKRVVLLVLSSILLLSPFVLIYNDLISTRLLSRGRVEQISINERQSDVREFSFKNYKHFLFGKGFGSYSLWQYIDDEEEKPAWNYQPIHNFWLLFIFEVGIFAVLSFLAFLFFYIQKVYKKSQKEFVLSLLTIIFFFIIFLFDHWVLTIPFGLWFLFSFLAIIE